MARMKRSTTRLRLADYDADVSFLLHCCSLVNMGLRDECSATLLVEPNYIKTFSAVENPDHSLAGVAVLPERAFENRQGLVATPGRLLNVYQAICLFKCSHTWHLQAQQVWNDVLDCKLNKHAIMRHA